MAKDEGWTWGGTAKELLVILNSTADETVKKLKGWPNSPRALSNHIRRLAANLAQAGIEVTTGERDTRSRARHRLITIKRSRDPPSAPSAPSGLLGKPCGR